MIAEKKSNSLFYISCIALLFAVILTYSNHFHNSFHFDDAHTIQNNIFIRDIKNIPQFFTDAKTFSSNPSNQSYRPIVSASLAVDYHLSENGNPFYFHLDNFIFFLFYIALIYLFVLKIFNAADNTSDNRFRALFVAALFALHPLAAETVNYIISRSDIISSAGVMAGMVTWLYFPGKRKYGIYLLPVVFGMLAKPSAAMFAPILFFTDLLLNSHEFKSKKITLSSSERFSRSVNTSLPAFVVCILTYVLIHYMTPDTWTPGGTSRWNYLITQPYVILLYIQNAILPSHLTADTDLSVFTSFDLKIFPGLFAVLILCFLVAITFKSRKWLPVALGLFWFFAALVPTSSIIPLAEVMNDHRMFFPLPGLLMALVWSIYMMLRNSVRQPVIITVLCILLLAGFAYGTHQRNEVWKTEETLWKDVTEKSPRNGRGLMNYGLTLMAKGQVNEALDYFERAKEFTPAYPILFVNIAIAKSALGNTFEAENNFLLALNLPDGADNPECNFYYARFLSEAQRYSEAKTYLQKALALAPAHFAARKLLEQIEGYTKDTPVIVTPQYFLNLSLRLYNEKKFYECIDACRQALQLKPDYAEAYNNICSAYNELKEYEKAIQACDSALKLNPGFNLAKNNYEYARKMLGHK